MDYQTELQQGLAFVEDRQVDKALKSAKSLIFLDPKKADGYHLAAICHQYLQNWNSSIPFLDLAIQYQPTNDELYNLRGFAYLSRMQFSQAEYNFMLAIKFGDHSAAHRNLGLLFIMRGEIAEGLNYLMDRVKDEPKDPLNWILIGDLLAGEGFTEKAKTYYKQALNMQSGRVWANKVETVQETAAV